ncbi:hypothetical protein DWW45_04265 [Sutterella sp. AF15-44LB]|nr:hypothetical protein DWW45_04265 [Sutterella sp. AF15-44LB]
MERAEGIQTVKKAPCYLKSRMPLIQILAGTAGRFTGAALTAGTAISWRGSVPLSRTAAVIGGGTISLTGTSAVPLSGASSIIHAGARGASRLRAAPLITGSRSRGAVWLRTVRTVGSIHSRTAEFRIRSRSIETRTGFRTGFRMRAGRRVRYRRVADVAHVVPVVIHRAAGKQRDRNRCRGPKKCSASHSAQLLSLREGMFLRTL